MIYVCHSVIATELYSDVNIISQISEKMQTNEPIPPKYKILKKYFF